MLKLIYAIFCILGLVNGLWMLFFPLSWYTDFPAAIPHTGAFNPHFIRDLGVAFLVIALAFGWCAAHTDKSRTIHLGVTLFFVGHALIHVFDILTGRLPGTHWLTDALGVFAPAIILIALAFPSLRKRLGERA